MASTNYIYVDLKTNVENCKLQEKILQGSTNRTFAFTLFDRGQQSLLGASAYSENKILKSSIVSNLSKNLKVLEVMCGFIM